MQAVQRGEGSKERARTTDAGAVVLLVQVARQGAGMIRSGRERAGGTCNVVKNDPKERG